MEMINKLEIQSGKEAPSEQRPYLLKDKEVTAGLYIFL